MFRFYSPPKNIFKDKIVISDKKEVHHLKDVLRLKRGDFVFVFDGKANEYKAEIQEFSDNRVILKIIDKKIFSKMDLEISVASAVPKGRRFDFVVEKLTELGIKSIIPLRTERSVVKIEKEGMRFKHWQNIILSACKQSGRINILNLEPQTDFEEILKRRNEFELGLIATVSGQAKNLKEVLKEKIKRILILIGPEGDFTSKEVNLAIQSGFIPVSLGNLVLRTETAAVILAGFVKLYYENS